MEYVISFLEGMITFISPCLLPMLPIYISYFAGGGERDTRRTLLCAAGFVLGFTGIFVGMGALAGTLGSFLSRYQTWVNLVSGMIVVLFGLNYMGLLRINLFRGGGRMLRPGKMNFFSAMVFGLIFSVGWTPCVGAFLGSALMLASQQGHVLEGMGLIVLHSGHYSKVFKKLMGTSCNLRWRHDDRERIWTVKTNHPIAEGVDETFVLECEEMYGEPFIIPEPLEVIFMGWFKGGEVFRSGCTWVRGSGKIFFFQPGHETNASFHNKNVQKILQNAVRWACPVKKNIELVCPKFEPLEG